MKLYVSNTEISHIRNSISINDELQEKPNSLSFKLGDVPKLDDYADVKAYEAFKILARDGTTITLDYDYYLNQETNLLAVNDLLTIDINEAGEIEKTITAVSKNSNNKIVLTVTPSGTDGTVGEYAGTLEFAGNIVKSKDANDALLTNLKWNVDCLDYTRLFDKELINDTYEDRDIRYMVNDMCNVTINYNLEVEGMEYADSTALQAVWAASGDGSSRTWNTSDYREGTGCGQFGWTFSGGTATFTATLTAVDGSNWAGVASGAPTKGAFGFHIKCSDSTAVTNIRIKLGSDPSHHVYWDIVPTDDEWDFPVDGKALLLTDATVVGTPNWTTLDYLSVVITETGTAHVLLDGFRLLEEEFFRHFPYVVESTEFGSVRFPRVKPIEVMQSMADSLGWYWFIDERRFIHAFPSTETHAPFDISEDSNNFEDLAVAYDLTRLLNRVVIQGAEETTSSEYTQAVEGDLVVREWIMKTKFVNLEVELDDGSVTDLMEAGTNTTTVNATAHGLVEGDYIVNRTRSNAVRKVLTVPSANQFTVEAVTGQTNGDTFSTFVTQTVGVENLNDEASYDYMSSYSEKSIRASSQTATLDAGDFLVFRYNEVIPIIVQRTENVSVSNMRTTLGYTDGVFDGQPIIDDSIQSRSSARDLADAMLAKYANVVITVTFKTSVHGLRTGQLITITDETNSSRSINQSFVIQKVKMTQIEEHEAEYSVTCSSLLYGAVEMLQQLFKQSRQVEIDDTASIDNVEDAAETIMVTDTVDYAVDDNKQSETILVADSAVSSVFEPPFKYGADPDGAIYGLSSYG